MTHRACCVAVGATEGQRLTDGVCVRWWLARTQHVANITWALATFNLTTHGVRAPGPTAASSAPELDKERRSPLQVNEMK